ncbi:MAG: hypothetical protein UY40_C0020G0008 [candidate division CPR1 bacterium GW2011_GWC1_49_13]|uniref:Uncharacterized protein n=1 Tax=candidate division CPR1 bacterium GW2011_GWC1_49_13 TaxID=1618342 RepID=A0A0G1VG38_9BACT|nr:MAG: hypothetical protein UY40_C0020G0008 [candidate division CPR1 bacterium GW2011_GWC1_49_13]
MAGEATIDLAALALRIESDAGTLRAAMAGLDAVERKGRAAGQSAVVASGGYAKLERALMQAAFATAGVSGPLGGLSRAFLQFATGGIATLAITGGIALVVSQIQRFRREAEAAKKATVEWLDSLPKAGPTLDDLRATLTQVQARISAINEQTRAREVLPGLALIPQRDPQQTLQLGKERVRLLNAERAIQDQINGILKEQATLRARTNKELRDEELALLQAETAWARYIDSWEQWDREARRQAEANRIEQAIRRTTAGALGDAGFQAFIEQQIAQAGRNLAKAQQLVNVMEAMNQAVANAVVEMGVGVAQAFADLLSGAAATFGGLGNQLAATAGRVLQTLGQTLIGLGIAKTIADKFLLVPGPAMIAAGVGIMAMGALLSRAAGAGAQQVFGGGGTAGAGATPGFVSLNQGPPDQQQYLASPLRGGGFQISPRESVVNHFTVIGPDDPAAQRQITALLERASLRGLRVAQ